ncbi:MAG: N-acetyltransferase [Methanobacteriota archaeon]
MRPRIRPFRHEDLDAVARMERECFPGPEGLSRRQLGALVKRGDVAALVAECGCVLGGFALLQFSDSTARLLTIDVAREFRGSGIGSALLEAADEAAAKVGCESISLEVRLTNLGAISLYRKAGYTETMVVEGYYPGTGGRPSDALEMQKRLSRPQ